MKKTKKLNPKRLGKTLNYSSWIGSILYIFLWLFYGEYSNGFSNWEALGFLDGLEMVPWFINALFTIILIFIVRKVLIIFSNLLIEIYKNTLPKNTEPEKKPKKAKKKPEVEEEDNDEDEEDDE